MGGVEREDPDRTGTLRLYGSGQRLGQAAEDAVGQHLADHVARGDGRGADGIDHGAGLGHEIEAGEGADVVWHMGGDHRLEAEHRVGVGVGARAVDAEERGRRGAGEIDRDLAALDGELGLQRQFALITVEWHFVGPLALRQRLDRLTRALLGLGEDVLRQRVERGKLELLHHVDQAARTRVVRTDEGEHVAPHLHGAARIGEDDGKKLLVELSLFPDPQVRDEGALLEGGVGLGRHADATHVNDVAGGREKGDKPLPQEHRRHHHIVEQVPGAEPRIVGDEDVSRLHGGLREVLEEMGNRGRHGVDMARGARHRLGDHVSFRVIDAGGQVARLTRDGAEGGAEQGLRLFLDDRDQAVPHDLRADGGECVLAHRVRSRTM